MNGLKLRSILIDALFLTFLSFVAFVFIMNL